MSFASEKMPVLLLQQSQQKLFFHTLGDKNVATLHLETRNAKSA